MASVTETPFSFSNANGSTSVASLLTDSDPSYVVAGVIAVLSCLVGIPTNILMIVKLSRHLRGSSMTKRLIFNLALSDLLSLFCLVIAGAIFATGPHLAHGLCQLFFFVILFCITSSSNILLLISVQRYYQILHHAKWKKVTRAWQRVLLSSVWVLGALLPLPLVLSLTDKTSRDAAPGKTKTSCREKMIEPHAEVVHVAIVTSAQLVVLVFYVKLVRGVRKVQMSDKKKQKINRLFTRILAVSLIDFLPLFARLVAIASHFTPSETLTDISRNLTPVEYLYFLNHCLNPLLYFFASRHQLRDREKKRKLFLMALNDSS
ncbi:C-X-C chemokine receptor type 5-like [Poeciliopsis prolifica]|uniref:C-X-C chemokine receptor type 5-like n=1 Tax=Poeciliopsis prolifica TaxID=188132 RepID=UPI00241388B1|nr:C-X-C chemokine receptor type 5-like [Poeciliopsis prolifica]